MSTEPLVTHWPKPSEHLPHETLIRTLTKYTPSALALVIWDGNGSAITAGAGSVIYIPFLDYSAIITGWQLIADASGSIVVDIWKDASPSIPTVADTITAAAKPTLSAAQINSSTTLTGWTTTINKGDILGFKVDSATTVARVTLALSLAKTSSYGL